LSWGVDAIEKEERESKGSLMSDFGVGSDKVLAGIFCARGHAEGLLRRLLSFFCFLPFEEVESSFFSRGGRVFRSLDFGFFWLRKKYPNKQASKQANKEIKGYLSVSFDNQEDLGQEQNSQSHSDHEQNSDAQNNGFDQMAGCIGNGDDRNNDAAAQDNVVDGKCDERRFFVSSL